MISTKSVTEVLKDLEKEYFSFVGKPNTDDNRKRMSRICNEVLELISRFPYLHKDSKIFNLTKHDNSMDTLQRALQIVTDARKKQVDVKGYTFDNDDNYVKDELSQAAAAYALAKPFRESEVESDIPDCWPWPNEYFKDSPDNRIKELGKAGALILADIERLLRLEKEINKLSHTIKLSEILKRKAEYPVRLIALDNDNVQNNPVYAPGDEIGIEAIDFSAATIRCCNKDKDNYCFEIHYEKQDHDGMLYGNWAFKERS